MEDGDNKILSFAEEDLQVQHHLRVMTRSFILPVEVQTFRFVRHARKVD
jgi:hypothetical protein